MAEKSLHVLRVNSPVVIAGSNSSPAVLGDRPHESRKASRQASAAGLDNLTQRQSSPRRDSELDRAGYDADATDDQGYSLEERLARDRIQHLHDVFVSAQGSEGLSMEAFRSAMREVLLKESGREMEDSELDKVCILLHNT